MDPDVLVDAVATRQDLADFVRALAHDVLREPDEWQNLSLADYLESLAAWIEVMARALAPRGEALPSIPSWRLVAQMLLAAKYHE